MGLCESYPGGRRPLTAHYTPDSSSNRSADSSPERNAETNVSRLPASRSVALWHVSRYSRRPFLISLRTPQSDSKQWPPITAAGLVDQAVPPSCAARALASSSSKPPVIATDPCKIGSSTTGALTTWPSMMSASCFPTAAVVATANLLVASGVSLKSTCHPAMPMSCDRTATARTTSAPSMTTGPRMYLSRESDATRTMRSRSRVRGDALDQHVVAWGACERGALPLGGVVLHDPEDRSLLHRHPPGAGIGENWRGCRGG